MTPRIAITMGDPAGVGPELCLRALAEASLRDVAIPVVFGDRGVLERVAGVCDLPMPLHVVTDLADVAALTEPALYHISGLDSAAVTPGRVDAATGRACYAYIMAAIDAALAGQVDGVCTAPIHKEALRAAGVALPGHTEIFAERTGTKRFCMMLTSEDISVSLVTTHTGICDVPSVLTVELVRDTIELTAEAMRRLRGREPRLVVCGLNPHAGEGGLFGRNEEEGIIRPAVQAAREGGLVVEGPLAPDTAFIPERVQATDAYVCMYHDQGLIPLKMLAFDRAVNVTLGLPIVRTSVDHGTALDLAWRGVARPGSMFEAVRLAARLSR